MATIKEIIGKREKHYQVTIRIKGYKPLYRTFEKKTEARNWAEDIETQMRKGKFVQTSDDKDIKPIITVKDLIDDFEKNIAPKRYSKPQQYKVMYDWWRNKIGHININDLTSATLTQCRNMLSKEPPDKPYKEHKYKSNSTVRKYMFAMSAILKYADRQLEIIDRNPMSRVDKPKKQKGVVRFLSDAEREELLTACKNYSRILYTFVVLAMFSGGRYSELLRLRVEDVDFENSMVYFLQTKNGENRGVPIYAKITEFLKKYLDDNNIESGYIFMNKNRTKLAYLKGAFENVVKNTSIKNFRFHDLRHTYASYLAQNGAELLEISMLLGHKTTEQTKIYAHLTKKHTSKIVRKMSANMIDTEL